MPPFSLFWATGRWWDHFTPSHPPTHTPPTSKEGKKRSRAPTGLAHGGGRRLPHRTWLSSKVHFSLPLLRCQRAHILAEILQFGPGQQRLVFHRWKWTSPIILAENLRLHTGFIVVFIGGAGEGRERWCVCTCVLGEREGGRGRGEKTSGLLKSSRKRWDVNIWLTERLNGKRKHTTIHFLIACEAPTVTAKKVRLSFLMGFLREVSTVNKRGSFSMKQLLELSSCLRYAHLETFNYIYFSIYSGVSNLELRLNLITQSMK